MPDTYNLRVAVRLHTPNAIGGAEQPVRIQVPGVLVTLLCRSGYLIVQSGGFTGADDARAFVPQVKAALWKLALEKNISFDPDFDQREITRAEDPAQAGLNLARTFNLPSSDPVHGIADDGGFVVYKEGETIRYVALGQLTVQVTNRASDLVPILETAFVGWVPGTSLDRAVETALDLYLAHFYEASPRAKLLTLNMVLEVLAPTTHKHAVAQQIIRQAKEEIADKLAYATDSEERDALESLQRELDFREETSIRRRVRRLVLDAPILDEIQRAVLARKVVAAYDLRGRIAHTGVATHEEIIEALADVDYACKLLLKARIGVLARNEGAEA